MSWLRHNKLLGELLSFDEKGEWVTTVVRKLDFSDFHCIIGKIVMDQVGDSTLAVELEDFSIVFEELLLRSNSSSSEFMFHKVLHHSILLRNVFVEGFVLEIIDGGFESLLLWLAEVFIEFSGVNITVVDEYIFAVDINFRSDSQVIDCIEFFILSQNLRSLYNISDCYLLSLKEGALRNTTIRLLGLSDSNRVIFEIEENLNLSDTVVLQIAFCDTFLEETVEPQDLGVKPCADRLLLACLI